MMNLASTCKGCENFEICKYADAVVAAIAFIGNVAKTEVDENVISNLLDINIHCTKFSKVSSLENIRSRDALFDDLYNEVFK